MLRYIDGIPFDYGQADILEFLKNKMKIEIDLYRKLFEDTGIGKKAASLDLKFSFPSKSPRGSMLFRIASGTIKNEDITSDALIWETMIDSLGESSPTDKDAIPKWIDQAHELTDDWFFKIIEGELQREFE